MATEKRLIDANALIDSGYDVTLDEVFPDWHELPESTRKAVCEHGQYLKKLINEQPTVDAVEVVHGRWLKNWCNNSFIGHEYAECSVCDCHMLDTNQFWNSNYCPNCGADMRERKDNATD